MNNFSSLSEEAYKRICSEIPHKTIVGYFQKNPKEFSKIRPGFRANALQNKDAIRLLVLNRERGFISSFVEGIVNDWIEEIKSVVREYQENGESEIVSYVHTLSQSFFSDNVPAFFKLIDKDFDEDQLKMISELVLLVKKLDEKQRDLEASVAEFEAKLQNSEKIAERNRKAIERAEKQIADLKAKLVSLKSIESQYLQSKSSLERTIAEKDAALLQIRSLTQQVASLNESVRTLQQEKTELEISIRARIEEEKEEMSLHMEPDLPLAPVKIDEFKEYFSYNLESIGVNNTKLPINTLLTDYISNIIFRGKPIICNKSVSGTLSKCIANALVGDAPVCTIAYSSDLDQKQICAAIRNGGRVVVLDNFLGNFNETVLLSILDAFKSKIIILTVTYEKTLFYLPKDFFCYGYYINLAHIYGFVHALIPDEDPSVIDEATALQGNAPSNNRSRDIVSAISLELELSRLLSEKVSEFVCDDASACAVLAFNVIPFICEVKGQNAFNISESLQRYVGRCPYRKLFEEWFMA